MDRYQTIISIDKSKVERKQQSLSKIKLKIEQYNMNAHDCMLIGSTSRYVGYRGHDYTGNLIVLYNISVGFFRHCDALVYFVRLHFFSLNTENAWLL
jgi:hypothetical protein